MNRYVLYPLGFFTLALLGGLTVALAQSPQTTVGGMYQATPPTLTDKQVAIQQLDVDGSTYVNLRDAGFYMTGTVPGTAPVNTGIVGGIYNTTPVAPTTGQTVALQLDPNGYLLVRNGNAQTYSAAALAVTPPATPTDIWCITGSASKTVFVKRLYISGIATGLSTIDLIVNKHSTADTGGTSAAITAVPHDSTNAAATATVTAYSVNPAAIGTVTGSVDTFKITLSTIATQNNERAKLYGSEDMQSIRLRGVAEQICINANSVTTTGNSYNITADWVER